MNLRDIANAVLAEDEAPQTDLQKHDARFHPNGFDPKKDHCEYREKLAKGDEADSIQGGEPQKSTKVGAVSSEDDAAYLDAVNRGDTKTAAEMVKSAFSKRMGKISPFVKEPDSEKPVFYGRPSKPNKQGWVESWTLPEYGKPDNESVFFNLKKVWGPADGFDGEPYSDEMLDFAAKNFCDTMEKAGVAVDKEEIVRGFRHWACESFSIDELIDTVGNEKFGNALKKLGYDGFANLVDDRNVTALDKSAVVPAAPVERDEDGNVIPLSKRVESAFGAETTKDAAPFNLQQFVNYLEGKDD